MQERRHLYKLWFWLTSLWRRRPVTLRELHAGIAKAYARCGFRRQLAPAEWVQLALNAGFLPAAAALMPGIAREAAAQRAAAAAAPLGSRGFSLVRRRARAPPLAAPPVPEAGIPAWRYRYFMWWLFSQLHTLCLLRAEWEQADQPRLVCGFDCVRPTADAMLFRRAKVGRACAGWRGACCRRPAAAAGPPHACAAAGQCCACPATPACPRRTPARRLPATGARPPPLQGTCLVRLGQEVGGVIVSLRPDKATLPCECAAGAVLAGHAGARAAWARRHRRLSWLPRRAAPAGSGPACLAHATLP